MIFAKARKEDIPTIFELIKKRMEWMDENHIHQWNEHDYLKVYPLSYYENIIDCIYVLKEKDRVVASAVVLEEDDRWNDSLPAFYIHNFVSDLSFKGAGKELLLKIEDLAKEKGKEYMRLDCDDDNVRLIAFYENMGYQSCGTCSDGPYHGVRKEKKL